MEFSVQVKESVDIVDVVGQYVRLKRVGNTQSHTGLCPFHQEKTPSFRVHSNHQFFKCFGCGEGGDVFTFLTKIEGYSFYEALKYLAERQGIPMPKRSGVADEDTKLRAAIYEMHELAVAAYQASLRGPHGTEARAYLARRGVSDAMIAEFQIGYSERGSQLTRIFEQSFTPDQLDKSGLIARSQHGPGWYDIFRNRLMFPIHNESGKIIGFGGRSLADDDGPKYLNSAESAIYRKSYVLFNLHRAKEAIRREDRTVLVEGYMDVIGVYAAGVREVVATCGTALTTQQTQVMRRQSQRIVVNFDPDNAGQRATEKSIPLLLEDSMQIRVLELEGGLDPDEFCKHNGPEAYREALANAPGYFSWLANRARGQHDMRTAEGRVAAFKTLLPSIHRLSDKIERVAVANEVASQLGVDQGLVLENFRKAAADRSERNIAAPVERVSALERSVLKLLIGSADARAALAPELASNPAVDSFVTRAIVRAVLALIAADEAFGFAEVDARLDEADRKRLAEILLDSGDDESLTVDGCVAKLRLMHGEERASDLRTKIKAAERSGDMNAALLLMKDLDDLRKRAGNSSTGALYNG